MRLRNLSVLIVTVMIFTVTIFAEEKAGKKEKHNMFGAHASIGMATTVNKFPDIINEAHKPRITGGFGLTYEHYFNKVFGIGTGVGILGKGDREGRVLGVKYKTWEKFIVMEIPVGFMFNFSGFRLGAALAFNFALDRKIKLDGDVVTVSHDWDNWDNWDKFRRFNIGPKVMIGYSIPIGPIGLLPSVSWTMDILNNFKNKAIDDDYAHRFMNLMFNLGIEFGI